MLGVKVVEQFAFGDCYDLIYVECYKLETVGACAFSKCKSLCSMIMPSAKVVEESAFYNCPALMDVTFGANLNTFSRVTFGSCHSLERITIPLKNGVVTTDDTFMVCINLWRVDLVEEEILHETIAALHMKEWRNDMYEELASINRILPNAAAGDNVLHHSIGKKARVIRSWIATVLRKITDYKAEHNRILNEAAATLQHALSYDIVTSNVLPFLVLPSHTFDGEEVADGNVSSSDGNNDGFGYSVAEAGEGGDENGERMGKHKEREGGKTTNLGRKRRKQ